MATKNRVHIITPLISEGFRDDSSLSELIKLDCQLSSRLLTRGPASVESAVDEVLAAPGVVDAAIKAEKGGAQAIVIDCMLDPGLAAAREAVSVPVVGAGAAGLEAAAALGRFSIVTVLDRQAPMFHALALRHGLADRLTSVRGIGVPVLELEDDRDVAIAKTIEACRKVFSEDCAEAIVFGCTGMLGFAVPVGEALGIAAGKIIDPLPNAVRAALAAIPQGGSGLPKPGRKRVCGFEAWKDLNELMQPEARL